ncbi:hypothetical protein BP6252_10279 [Coleophoma cylindrospora]|uniref:Heterokaryon incompatibility domain-containing protein n=1 Tax=Coleophoma cylindrospora TaxID=1849047 RepID=A0A3D8QSH6_9HELO|nr:hypothetical protein BP6252_10279 [Coleophoma cylindrospora]
MRLLDARTLDFEEFSEGSIPPYAILSHTWGGEKVTLQSFQRREEPLSAGHRKIVRACEETLKLDLQYVWVDSCCIDKTSSREMTEAINSMFKWYQMAEICLVYLVDLHTTILPHGHEPGPDLESCAWFTRGWTLQELLAPNRLLFFGSDWTTTFSLDSVVDRVNRITGIAPQYLLHNDQKVRQSWISQASVAEKMSWASERETTIPEDMAYCLLGIFGVNMPLIYGEGKQAFIRLQEQIIRNRFDPTLFAWNAEVDGKALLREDMRRRNPLIYATVSPAELGDNTWGKGHQLPKVNRSLFAITLLLGMEHPWCHVRNGYVSDLVTGFLAESPRQFHSCSDIILSEATVEWSLTSKGSILIQLPVSEDKYPRMVLPCGIRGDPFSLLALPLVPDRGGQYTRAKYPANVVSHNKWQQWPMKKVDLVSQYQDLTILSDTLKKTLHLGNLPPGYEVSEVYPGEAWSPVNGTISLPFVPTGGWHDTPAAVLLLQNPGTNTSFAITLKVRQPRLVSLLANFGDFGSMYIDPDFIDGASKEDLPNLYKGISTGYVPRRVLLIAPSTQSSISKVSSDILYADFTRKSLTGSQFLSINIRQVPVIGRLMIQTQYAVISALVMSKFFDFTDILLRPGSRQPHIPWNSALLVGQVVFDYLLNSSYFSFGRNKFRHGDISISPLGIDSGTQDVELAKEMENSPINHVGYVARGGLTP